MTYAIFFSIFVQSCSLTLMEKLSSYQLDKSFKAKHIQFFVVTQERKTDIVKETLRKIERIFVDLNETLEADLGVLGEESGLGINQRIEVFEIVRSEELEHRFGLQKQLLDDDRPVKIDKSSKGKLYVFISFTRLYDSYD